MNLEQYEQIQPKTILNFNNTNEIIFFTPSIMTKWRVDSIYQKEPITLEWLSELNDKSVLLDIGANVGMYSIIAAKIYKAKVYAFEPEPINYSVLAKNIMLNNLSSKIDSYPAGISDIDGFTSFYIADTRIGGSNNSINKPINFRLEELNYKHKISCISYKLNTLVTNNLIDQPTHIKIDVDGLEHLIIENGLDVIKSSILKSLIIEINPRLKEHQGMIKLLDDYNFKFDPSQVEKAARKDGPFKGMAEYVFRKPENIKLKSFGMRQWV